MHDNLQNRPKAKIAYQKIRDAIVSGEKLPGTRLIPADLEKEMRVGRVPIREALLKLSQTGLVLIESYKGAIVSIPPTLQEFQEIYEIRYMLEGKAAESGAAKISHNTILEMEEIHAEMCLHPNSTEPFFRLNREFHMTLYEASEKYQLLRIIDQLINKVETFRTRYPFELADYQRFNKEHASIIALLRNREPRKVKAELISHLRGGYETLISVYHKIDHSSKLKGE